MRSFPPSVTWTTLSSSFVSPVSSLERWLERIAPWHLWLVMIAAVAARAPIFFGLEAVTTGWHAADYGSIARNYYFNGFQLAYPEIDWGGDRPGYVEMEFPIVPFLTALIYKLAGGIDDRLAVIVPFASGLLAVWFAYLLARELFRPSAAFLAGFVVAMTPVFARYSGLFFPEVTLLAASSAALYAMLLWSRSGRRSHLIWAALATSLAVLLKPTSLVLGAPLLWLFWLHYGRSFWRQPAMYVFGVAVLIPPFWWYAHALQLAQEYGNSFGILFGGGPSKMATADLLLSVGFYAKLGFRLVFYHMTPLGFVAAGWALVRTRFSREQQIVPLWFWSSALTLFVAAVGNDEVPYYQLPVIMPACLLAGVGLVQMEQDLTGLFRARSSWAVATALLLTLTAGLLFGRVLHDSRADYVVWMQPARQNSVELGQALRPGALIVFSSPSHAGQPRGGHVTPPWAFYFSGHRGWYVAPEWLTVKELDDLRSRGAQYVVADHEREMKQAPADVQAWLRAFPRAHDIKGHAVWDISLANGHSFTSR